MTSSVRLPRLEIGDRIKVVAWSNKYHGMKGVVREHNKHHDGMRFRVGVIAELQVFGRAMLVELNRSEVRLV